MQQHQHESHRATPTNRRGISVLDVIVCIVIVLTLVALFLPAVRSSREPARRSQCKNNLKLIMLGLHNYADVQGVFPPPYAVDETGQPLHSWRPLILPNVEQHVYQSIDLMKPWNDQANAEAFATRILDYQCPSAGLKETSTTYMGIVGPEEFYHPKQTRRFRDITDGVSNTIAVVEVTAARSVHWMEPVDTDANFLLNVGGESVLSHHGGWHVALVDGSVRFLPRETSPENLRALTTISAGDRVSDF